jgi:EF hand
MFKARISLLVFLFVATLFAIGSIAGVSFAQKDAAPKPQDKLALGENQVTQLLLLMNTNKDGKITKQEWMKFMEAEFDRLDRQKSGAIDTKEVTQSKLRVSPVAPPVGK